MKKKTDFLSSADLVVVVVVVVVVFVVDVVVNVVNVVVVVTLGYRIMILKRLLPSCFCFLKVRCIGRSCSTAKLSTTTSPPWKKRRLVCQNEKECSPL